MGERESICVCVGGGDSLMNRDLPTMPELLAWSILRLVQLFSQRSVRYCLRVRTAMSENFSLLRLALQALITGGRGGREGGREGGKRERGREGGRE